MYADTKQNIHYTRDWHRSQNADKYSRVTFNFLCYAQVPENIQQVKYKASPLQFDKGKNDKQISSCLAFFIFRNEIAHSSIQYVTLEFSCIIRPQHEMIHRRWWITWQRCQIVIALLQTFCPRRNHYARCNHPQLSSALVLVIFYYESGLTMEFLANIRWYMGFLYGGPVNQ